MKKIFWILLVATAIAPNFAHADENVVREAMINEVKDGVPMAAAGCVIGGAIGGTEGFVNHEMRTFLVGAGKGCLIGGIVGGTIGVAGSAFDSSAVASEQELQANDYD